MITSRFFKEYPYKLVHHGSHGHDYIEGEQNNKDDITKKLEELAICLSEDGCYSYLFFNGKTLSKIEVNKFREFCFETSFPIDNPQIEELKQKKYRTNVFITSTPDSEEHPKDLIALLIENGFSRKKS